MGWDALDAGVCDGGCGGPGVLLFTMNSYRAYGYEVMHQRQDVDQHMAELKDPHHVYWHVAWAPKVPGVRVRSEWWLGRYGTWYVEVIDQRCRSPVNGRVCWRCRSCGKPTNHGARHYCSEECRVLFTSQVFEPFNWNLVRDRALRRDDFTCVLCGVRPFIKHYEHGGSYVSERERDPAHPDGPGGHVFLEVDHIEPVAIAPEREFDEENLRTLCRVCHGKHGKRPQSVVKTIRPLDTRLAIEGAEGKQ